MIRHVAVGVAATLLSCSKPLPLHSEKPVVFVSILPQQFFVERIAADRVTVKVLIPPGASPHSYEPRPAQMTDLSKAQLFLSIGVEIEAAWLPRIRSLNPRLKIVATDSGINKLPMDHELVCVAPGEGSLEHSHGGHDRHDNTPYHSERHAGFDPHIWLAPSLVREQARVIAGALAMMDPADSSGYFARLAVFEKQIDSLRLVISEKMVSCGEKRTFLVFHPSWQYFAREFSLRQIAIEIEGKEPGLRELEAIVTCAKRHGIGAIFVQPQFSRKLAETVGRRIGAKVVEADPLALDWLENLSSFAGALCVK